MLWREIGGGESFEGIAGGLINDVDPVLAHAPYGTATGLGYEVFLGCKVTIEAAVGEACGFHEIGDADAVDAAFAKQTRGDIQDSLVIFGFLLAADSHDAALSGVCFGRANYMTRVMLKRCRLWPAVLKFASVHEGFCGRVGTSFFKEDSFVPSGFAFAHGLRWSTCLFLKRG
jgi:hypothetical protein